MRYYFFCFLFVVMNLNVLIAQPDENATYYKIETNSDQSFTGELIKIRKDSILILNEKNDLLGFSKDDVRKFQEVLLSRKFMETTNTSVPYYVQSAIPNGDGNHYYKNYFLFGNELNFGMSDNWNLSLGFETATLVFNSGNKLPIVQLGTKYARSVAKNIYMGTSAKFYRSEEGNLFLLSSPFTVGNNRNNFTISPTMAASENEQIYGILINVSLETGSRSRFVFDMARLEGENVIAIVIERMFNSGFTFSAGALVTSDGTIPNMEFSVPFGAWQENYGKKPKK